MAPPPFDPLVKLLPELAAIQAAPLRWGARYLGYQKLAAAFFDAAQAQGTDGQTAGIFHDFLARLGIRYTLESGRLCDIPQTGAPLLIVANHAYGLADGLVAAALVSKIRPDFKLAVNPELARRLPELQNHLIGINPHTSRKKPKRIDRAVAMLQARNHLRSGGCLIVFPAGRIARPPVFGQPATDTPWKNFAALLALDPHIAPTVMPLYFPGRNSIVFESLHAVGITGPTRVVMMAMETLRLARTGLRARLGEPVDIREYPEATASPAALTGFLRTRTFAL